MYRTEYPNPQFQRETYKCLNGMWEFEIGSGEGKINTVLEGKIQVPFCVESELSGIGVTEHFKHCVYSKEIQVDDDDLQGRYVLHFGAVDYHARVYCNGVLVGEHRGGYTPFEMDIAPYCAVGTNRITVLVTDDIHENVPSGKQTNKDTSFGCFYTRVTGIWQTVWLERTPKNYIKNFRFYPNAQEGKVQVEMEVEGTGEVEINISYEGKPMGAAKGEVPHRYYFDISLAEIHLWELGCGRLYDVTIQYGEDKVQSYFGLRDVAFRGKQFLLNGKSVFQRLVLDQGYYEKGIYTAESEQMFVDDIEKGLDLGFNGTRMHQKLFEPRFLYHCDKMGYMAWGEYASWGMHYYNLDGLSQFTKEWIEAVERDFNHPSIVIWCPLNETWMDLQDTEKARDIRFVEAVHGLTKALDKTRPCVDVSGGYHGKYTDLWDIHNYFSAENLKEEMRLLEKEGIVRFGKGEINSPQYQEENAIYDGELPVQISEYGGVSFSAGEEGWGYISSSNEEEFIQGYIDRTELLLKSPILSGFCYTQLYDIEQEQNGLFYYGREAKFSKAGMQKIAECNRQLASIEKEGNS